jgi:O-antigen/teichoic acid export membrane protein
MAVLPEEVAASIGLNASFRGAAFLIPLAATGVAGMAAMRGLAVRQGWFSRIGMLQVIRALILIVASFAMGFMGLVEFGIGLIAGQALGDLVFAVMLWRELAPRNKSRLLTLHPRKMLESIQREASAVKTLSLTQAMAILYERSPPLVILSAFGPVEAGFYALAVRIAQAPATLVASAFDDVFRQRAARIWAQGKRFTQLMRYGIALTLAMSVVPMGLAMLATPFVVEPVFGHEWGGAATTLIVMLGVSIFSFNSKSFDKVPIMLKAHRFIFAWHSMRLSLEVSAGTLAILGVIDYDTWLLFVAVGRSVLYAIKLVACFSLARTTPLQRIKTQS